jgi:hypothetical protein
VDQNNINSNPFIDFRSNEDGRVWRVLAKTLGWNQDA